MRSSSIGNVLVLLLASAAVLILGYHWRERSLAARAKSLPPPPSPVKGAGPIIDRAAARAGGDRPSLAAPARPSLAETRAAAPAPASTAPPAPSSFASSSPVPSPWAGFDPMRSPFEDAKAELEATAKRLAAEDERRKRELALRKAIEKTVVVQGIVSTAAGDKAIINGEMVRVGDMVDGVKVVRIRVNQVILQKDGKLYTKTVEQREEEPEAGRAAVPSVILPHIAEPPGR